MIAETDRHSFAFREVFIQLKQAGRLVRPRDQLCIEVENFSYILPPYVRFQNFAARKFKLSYTLKEFQWYLRGDRFDRSICDHAKIWQDIVNDDGSINSNYGQYIFHGPDNQFDNVVRTLVADRDSRRASIAILGRDHLLSSTKDVPCTHAIDFRIRDGELNMSVLMRSQDGIFGMASDAPCFSFVHEMVLEALRETYPDLRLGNYHHFAGSFHVYERHFGMLNELTGHGPGSQYELIDCPRISGPDEVKFLRALEFSNVPEGFAFTRWLVANS